MMQNNAVVTSPDKKKTYNAFTHFAKKFMKRKASVFGLSVIILLAVCSFVVPALSKYTYDGLDMANRYQAPTMEHWFGTDSFGRDILVRIFYGGRYSLSIGIVSVAISAGGGLILGSIAGFFGGAVDNAIMRFLDIFHSIPQVLLAVCISAVLGPGFFKTVMAVGIGGIPNFSRVIRAQILSVRQLEYVEAATSINCRNMRIIFRHVVPNAITPFIVQCALAIANGLIVASTLSYVGLGIQPPLPEWGAILTDAVSEMRRYPYLMLSPGLFIMVTVLSFNLIGDAVRDILDPKLKK